MEEILATYSYELINNDTEYSITCSNINVCTKAIIPSEYNGKPVTAIGNYAFSNCSSLTSVTIGDSVTSIGSYAFEYCSKLTSVTIGDSVTSIGWGAFAGCGLLESIVIPKSVISIGEEAFFNCSSLESVIFFAKTPAAIFNSFQNTSSSLKFYCYSNSLQAYKTATNWSDYADKIIADDLKLHFTSNAIATKKYILDVTYPVGSIYMSMMPTDPSILFGGSWERLQDMFLLGASDTYPAGLPGGEKEVTLTTKQIPSHAHDLAHNHDGFYTNGVDGEWDGKHSHTFELDNGVTNLGAEAFLDNDADSDKNSGTYTISESGAHYHYIDIPPLLEGSAYSGNTGKGQSHNNMPPYLAVYMWKRIS